MRARIAPQRMDALPQELANRAPARRSPLTMYLDQYQKLDSLKLA